MDSHILQVALTHLTKPIYGVNEKKKKKQLYLSNHTPLNLHLICMDFSHG